MERVDGMKQDEVMMTAQEILDKNTELTLLYAQLYKKCVALERENELFREALKNARDRNMKYLGMVKDDKSDDGKWIARFVADGDVLSCFDGILEEEEAITHEHVR